MGDELSQKRAWLGSHDKSLTELVHILVVHLDFGYICCKMLIISTAETTFLQHFTVTVTVVDKNSETKKHIKHILP